MASRDIGGSPARVGAPGLRTMMTPLDLLRQAPRLRMTSMNLGFAQRRRISTSRVDTPGLRAVTTHLGLVHRRRISILSMSR